MTRTVLTSWKEIAQYVGKGVRTVQRWEHYFGLPVRRPNGGSHHAVLALPDELDEWMRQRASLRNEEAAGPELQWLRNRVIELQQENENLRAELLRLAGNPAPPGETDGGISLPRLN